MNVTGPSCGGFCSVLLLWLLRLPSTTSKY
jgi:hypothetical protein